MGLAVREGSLEEVVCEIILGESIPGKEPARAGLGWGYELVYSRNRKALLGWPGEQESSAGRLQRGRTGRTWTLWLPGSESGSESRLPLSPGDGLLPRVWPGAGHRLVSSGVKLGTA